MKSLKNKIDTYLWAFMWLLPFLAYFVAFFNNASNAPLFLTYIDDYFAFDFIKDIFDDVFSAVFGNGLAIDGLLSYLVAVEIGHVMFDVVVFIPRMAHKFIDWGCNLWQKD